MEPKLVGRQYEWDLLDEVMKSGESEMVIVYGRRRVGKTFLINRFFDNTYAFKHTGVFNKAPGHSWNALQPLLKTTRERPSPFRRTGTRRLTC